MIFYIYSLKEQVGDQQNGVWRRKGERMVGSIFHILNRKPLKQSLDKTLPEYMSFAEHQLYYPIYNQEN